MDVKEDDNVCIVCWREIHVYAIGLCDHPVCHECSTRMRVLCRKSECPICRRNLPKVIFVKQAKPFEELNKRLYQVDAHPQVCFEDDSVRQAYRSLLENRCKYCPPGTKRPVFTNFGMLRTHVRREHHRTFCDLCVEHLRIFPGERTAYSKKDLARHLHTGDLDDTSHKGHPLCQFCDVRYFDNDELYRHLRREHYYCHFCGDDYRLQYYRNYEYLRDHFRQEHFLCEEGDCRNETFTAAFRSEIDLKAHRAQHHNRSMTKAQAKQARTLDLEFSIAPRGTHHGGGSTGASGHHEDGGPVRRLPRHSVGHQRPNNRSTAFPQSESRDEQPTRSLLSATQRPAPRQSQNLDLTWETQPPVDYHCDKEFPQLCSEGAAGGAAPSAKTGSFMPTPYSSRRTEQVNFNSVDEFPSLNPSAAPPQPSSSAMRAPSSATRAVSSAVRASSATKAPSSATRAPSSATRAPSSATRAPSSATGAPSSAKSHSNGPMKGRGYQEDGNNNSSSNGNSGSDYGANVTVRLVQPQSSTVTSASAVVSARNGSKVQPALKGPPKSVSEEDFPVLTSRVVPRMTKVSAVPPATAVESGPPWQQVKTKKKKADEPKQASLRTQQPTVADNSSGNNTNNNNPPAPKSSANKPSAPNSSSSAAKPSASKPSASSSSSSATNSLLPAKQNAPVTSTNKMANGTNATNNLLQLISAARKGDTTRPAHPPLAASDGESSDSEDERRRTTGTTVLSQNDFPCLNGRPTAAPPGFQKPKPPPGFARSADAVGVGVGISLASMAAAVPPAQQAPRYTQPAGFQQRNLKLIVEIQKILAQREGEENNLFAQFKSLSGAFRQGTLSAADYYARCIEVFGSEERFQVVFPELLFLLPDIRKQQELMGTYNAHRKACGSSTGALSKNGAAAVQLLVCATCQQVLSADDFRSHRTLHDPV